MVAAAQQVRPVVVVSESELKADVAVRCLGGGPEVAAEAVPDDVDGIAIRLGGLRFEPGKPVAATRRDLFASADHVHVDDGHRFCERRQRRLGVGPGTQ